MDPTLPVQSFWLKKEKCDFPNVGFWSIPISLSLPFYESVAALYFCYNRKDILLIAAKKDVSQSRRNFFFEYFLRLPYSLSLRYVVLGYFNTALLKISNKTVDSVFKLFI